jgi:hypothetical protein
MVPVNVGLLTGRKGPPVTNVDCGMVEPFPRTRFVPESVETTPDVRIAVPEPEPMVVVPFSVTPEVDADSAVNE